ncbi:MAG: aminotransferase class I/II-fold pyridoxal phosphate-dependent enzyme, partial [Candidatus Omnitrophota bacterium]
MKNILVTGGAGYLGSVLSKMLVEKGYNVRCFDRLYFGKESIKDLLDSDKFELIEGNLLNLSDFPDIFDGIDAVIHLAGLANDPTAELDPEVTSLVNYEYSRLLAEKAKEKGVSHFVFASSCSVYGKSLVDIVSEESPLNPVSVYAETKMRAEVDILKMADDDFHPVSLRQATLYGVSPRMRFDLAINLMVMNAVTKNRIFIMGGGDQWRPFLHVEDAADAFVFCLEQPPELISGKIYNLGATEDNFKIAELAQAVKKHIDGVELDVIPDNPDKRSYRVSCEKIKEELGWAPSKSMEDGIKDIREFVASNKQEGFDVPQYYNIKTLQDFIKTPASEEGDPVRHDFLPFCKPLIGKKEEEELLDTLHSGWITTGPKVHRLEEKFKEYLGCEHAVCVNSCTAALHLSLVALGIGPGDEVITTPVTWPSTANVIVHTGATPVFADVDKKTLNILPGQIEKRITDKTKAVIPVH